MLGVPVGVGVDVEVGVVDVDGEVVKVGLCVGMEVGEGEGLSLGRSGMMLKATSGTTVATTTITMRTAASNPLFIPLPIFADGGGGGGG